MSTGLVPMGPWQAAKVAYVDVAAVGAAARAPTAAPCSSALTKLVFDDRKPHPMVAREDVVDERGLPAQAQN